MQSPDSASPAPYPVTSQEQQDMVRRRSLPIAISGAICGIGGLALLLTSPVGLNRPPNIYAVNLSFCAMMMGIGILFYARHTPGTRGAAVACIVAMLTGFVGPLVYTKQSLDFKRVTESGELANVAAITAAARQYAEAHDGNYAPDLATLLEVRLVTIETLHSPYEAGTFAWPATLPGHDELEKLIDEHADFQYFGAGVKIVDAQGEQAKSEFDHIIIAAKRYPIARKEISIAFGDGHADFVGGDDWEILWTRSNDARRSLGFPEIRRPSTSEPASISAPPPRPAMQFPFPSIGQLTQPHQKHAHKNHRARKRPDESVALRNPRDDDAAERPHQIQHAVVHPVDKVLNSSALGAARPIALDVDHAPTLAFITSSDSPISTAVGITSFSFDVSSAINIITTIIPIGTPAPIFRPFACPYRAMSPSLIGPEIEETR